MAGQGIEGCGPGGKQGQGEGRQWKTPGCRICPGLWGHGAETGGQRGDAVEPT